tara:strand:+ start:3462 stop:5579 length:2118 start_codon:yes stop_codon:yes gene_type:complete
MAEDIITISDLSEELNEDELGALVPEGINGLSAKTMFNERNYYKEAVYPDQVPTPFDLWYDRSLFGKLDFEGNPIFPFKDNMKQLAGDNANVWVFDFVADAFNDFKTTFLFVNKKDIAGTPFELLDPQRGWTSTIVEYDKYMDSVYNRFITYVEQTNRDKEMISFDKFMDVFYDFINIQSPKTPITLSQYIISPLCSPADSGLMIDISLDEHGNDENKYINFINNRNFICYAEMAQEFGFKIDKNFPGRLIADINSPVMSRDGDPTVLPSQGGMGYMRKYPKKPQKFIKKPPKEPQLKILMEPSPVNQIPFSVGDRVSFSAVRLPQADGTGFYYTILRDYAPVKNKQTELRQSISDHPLGKLVTVYGIIEAINVEPTDTDSFGEYYFGRGYTSLRDGGVGYTRGVPGSVVFNIRHPKNMDTYPQDGRGWDGGENISTASDSKAAFRTIAEMSDTRTGEKGEHVSWTPLPFAGKTRHAPERKGRLYLEVPLDAVHLKEDNLPSVVKRFNERVSYPVRLQKYNKEKEEDERLYRLKLDDYYNQTRPAYRKAVMAYKKKLAYYKNPFNRLTVNNIFNKRYRKSYLEDMFVLKEICMQFYYSYTSENPEVIVTKLVRENGGAFLTKTKVVAREQISKEIIKQRYPQTYWIKQYILIRNAESENKKTFRILKIISRKTMEVYETQGLAEALKYIKKKMPAKAYESVINLR